MTRARTPPHDGESEVTQDTGVTPAGSGHSPKGGASISVESPAKPSVPNAVICTSVVLEHTDADAQKAFARELFERYPFDATVATRVTAFSYSQDALSTLDFIQEALNDSDLDSWDAADCVRDLLACHGAYDKLRDVAAEWKLPSALAEQVSA